MASYSEVPVEVKESDTMAWMKLFEAPPSPLVPHPAGPDTYVDPLTRSLGAGVLPRDKDSIRVRVSLRFASDVISRASATVTQRSGAWALSGRIAPGSGWP